jgi:hypothetical protein
MSYPDPGVGFQVSQVQDGRQKKNSQKEERRCSGRGKIFSSVGVSESQRE